MYQKQITEFRRMIKMDAFPHLLLVEALGSDINYVITKFLEELYGETQPEHKELEYCAYGKKHYLNMESHAYYRIIKLNRFVHCDQSMMETLVSDFTESIHMGVFQENQIQYRTIIVQNVGFLSTVTQASMRRLIEKVHVICRFIFCSSNMSSIIDPLRSRCIIIRIPSLDNKIQKEIIELVEDQKNPKIISHNINENILINRLLKQNNVIPDLPWETIINQITDWLLGDNEINSSIISVHRQNLYSIMRYNLTGTYILKTLYQSLVTKDSNQLRLFEVLALVSDLEQKLKIGNKDIFYLEAFLLNAYEIYRKA